MLLQVRRYVEDRQEVGDHLVRLQNYTDTFLPIALRFVSALCSHLSKAKIKKGWSWDLKNGIIVKKKCIEK